MTEPRTQSFAVPDIGPSANEFYAGMHWATRRKLAEAWHRLVINQAFKYHLRPVKGRVDLTVECSFGPGRRAFDSSNCSATVKLVEDGLVLAKILKGDGPKYVRWVKMLARPRALVTLTLITLAEVEG